MPRLNPEHQIAIQRIKQANLHIKAHREEIKRLKALIVDEWSIKKAFRNWLKEERSGPTSVVTRKPTLEKPTNKK